jgi:putative membrane protein
MPHPHHPSAFGVGLAVAAVATAYVLGLRRLGGRSHGLPAWRSAAFLLGVGTIWAAVGSPLASGDAGSLTGHMVQHLLLMSLAPPLLLLGEPLRVMFSGRSRLRRAIGRRFPGRTSLRAAAACWLAGSGTLVLWHVPAVFAMALRSPTWHAIEQVSFLVTGLFFWWPVIEPWPGRPLPSWSIVLYLFLATLPCDILSAFLVFSDRIAYGVYLSGDSSAAVLADQQRAGALMWTCVTIIYLVAGTLVSARLLTFGGGDSSDRPTGPPRATGTAPRPADRAARVA